MPILRLEHSIRDFAAWKQAFDRDPAGRERHGVRGYCILRPTDDRNYIVIDLEFDDAPAAETFVHAMRAVWASKTAAPALVGLPTSRVFEVVESSVPTRSNGGVGDT